MSYTTVRNPRPGSPGIAARLATAAAMMLTAAIALLGVTSPAACASGPGSHPDRVDAVSTIGMIHDAVRIIGGDRVNATGLMGEGVDPHLYKATPGDVRLLADADVVFYNGLHLEGRMADVLVRMARKTPVVAVSESIEPSLLREPPEFGGHYDPHVWFDVSLWSKAVERVRDGLIEVDPNGRATYEANAASYLKQLGELHEWCASRFASVPKESRVLVTAHDAFGYLGRAYGVEVLAIQGISTDSEASLRDINHLVDTLVERKVPAVFIESTVPRKTVEALVQGCKARGHEVVIGGELFSDAMGADGTPAGTYVGMVRHNVETIVKALMPSSVGGEPAPSDGKKDGSK
jgi:manganese/zinc/iron transport system substrate-binding protein